MRLSQDRDKYDIKQLFPVPSVQKDISLILFYLKEKITLVGRFIEIFFI